MLRSGKHKRFAWPHTHQNQLVHGDLEGDWQLEVRLQRFIFARLGGRCRQWLWVVNRHCKRAIQTRFANWHNLAVLHVRERGASLNGFKRRPSISLSQVACLREERDPWQTRYWTLRVGCAELSHRPTVEVHERHVRKFVVLDLSAENLMVIEAWRNGQVWLLGNT